VNPNISRENDKLLKQLVDAHPIEVFAALIAGLRRDLRAVREGERVNSDRRKRESEMSGLEPEWTSRKDAARAVKNALLGSRLLEPYLATCVAMGKLGLVQKMAEGVGVDRGPFYGVPGVVVYVDISGGMTAHFRGTGQMMPLRDTQALSELLNAHGMGSVPP
jgi:hypothetical protein